MELTWIEDFLALAASGSFSRAAEQRHVTQPAFSRRIKALEDWLGVVLFDRSAHPAVLTEAGRRFRPRAEELLRLLVAAREEARQAQEATGRTLRFAATHALSLTFFPAWLRALEPRLELGPVQLVSDTLQACEALMLAGGAQFLLCHQHPRVPGGLDAAAFQSLVVGHDELLPVAAADAAGAPRFSLAGAPGERVPVLTYSEQSGLGRILRALHLAGPAGPRLEPAFTSHLAVVLKSMALDGRGVAWLPRSLIGAELAARQLLPVGDAAWCAAVEVRLFRRRGGEAPAAEALWQAVARG